MPLMGNLRQFALPNVLRSIESEQRTGRLRLANGGTEGAIYFTSGQWALLSRPGGDLPLAEQFLRARLITPEDFEAATGAPASEVGRFSDSQAVQMLIRGGALRQDQLRAWATDDAVTMLATALTWSDADFLFEDGVVIPAGRIAAPLNVSSLIDQAQRRLRENVSRTPPPLSPEMVLDFAEVDPEGDIIRITREQWRMLIQIDGHTPLLSISQRLDEPELPVLRLASQLVANGILLVVGRAS